MILDRFFFVIRFSLFISFCIIMNFGIVMVYKIMISFRSIIIVSVMIYDIEWFFESVLSMFLIFIIGVKNIILIEIIRSI